MIYTDDEGFPVGQWKLIDRDTYIRLVLDAGGLDALVPFGTATDPGRRVYTEWGREGDETPLVSHERYGPVCRDGVHCTCDSRHRQFVLFATADA